jgi:hypothetical protein
MDVQIKAQKCKELEERLLNLDRKKFLVELKAKETEDTVNKVRQSAKLELSKTQIDK